MRPDAKNSWPSLDIEIRELSKHQVRERACYAVFPLEQSSIWRMYLCQPPPTELRVTIWKKEASIAAVSEKFSIRGWTLREIFDNVEEARRSTSKPLSPQFAAVAKTSNAKELALRAMKGEKMNRFARGMLDRSAAGEKDRLDKVLEKYKISAFA